MAPSKTPLIPLAVLVVGLALVSSQAAAKEPQLSGKNAGADLTGESAWVSA